LSNLKLSLLVF